MHLPSPRLPGVLHQLIYWAQALLGPGPQQQDASYPGPRGTHSRTPFSAQGRFPTSKFDFSASRLRFANSRLQTPGFCVPRGLDTDDSAHGAKSRNSGTMLLFLFFVISIYFFRKLLKYCIYKDTRCVHLYRVACF